MKDILLAAITVITLVAGCSKASTEELGNEYEGCLEEIKGHKYYDYYGSKCYVCTGPSAYAFHSKRSCAAGSCSGSVVSTTVAEALCSYGRSSCGTCGGFVIVNTPPVLISGWVTLNYNHNIVSEDLLVTISSDIGKDTVSLEEVLDYKTSFGFVRHVVNKADTVILSVNLSLIDGQTLKPVFDQCYNIEAIKDCRIVKTLFINY